MKNILLLTNVWNLQYITNIIDGMQAYIDGKDIRLDIMNAYAVIQRTEYGELELNIYKLPDLSKYDGILLAVNSVLGGTEIDRLIEKTKESGCKFICIDQPSDKVPFTGIDNYKTFYNLVEHMITVHDCKVMNYLGGPEDHLENKIRFQAFCDCLKAHNLEVDPARVQHLMFLHYDGTRAYNAWKKLDLHLPDAVICANDNMAMGYYAAANADGYNCPQDVRITGFDNIEEAQMFSPSITSVNRNLEQLGYDSMARLIELIDGANPEPYYYTEGVCVYNESCGCQPELPQVEESFTRLYRESKALEDLDIHHRTTLELLWNAKTGMELADALNECCRLLEFPKMAVHLNFVLQSEDSIGSDYSASSKIMYTNTGIEKQSDSLIPASWVSKNPGQTYIFSPMHFCSDILGYCVIPYTKDMLKYIKHRKYIDNLALALSIIWQRQKLNHANQQLQVLYVQDQLTGLYNRFGYEGLAQDYFRKQSGRIYLMFMDLDNLKTYNDVYGHAIGDLAIKGAAEGIKAVLTNAPIQVRMGGDEFLAIGPYIDEENITSLENQLNQWLVDYSTRCALPFPLTVSIGHAFSIDETISMEQLVKQADNMMYIVKKAKKKAKKEAENAANAAAGTVTNAEIDRHIF